MRYRIEKDQLGERQVPAEAYYGIETLRGKENFEITKRGIYRQLIKALAIVKKAAAKANFDAGNIDEKTGKAIEFVREKAPKSKSITARIKVIFLFISVILA